MGLKPCVKTVISQQSLIATSPSPSTPFTILLLISDDLEQFFASSSYSQIDTIISISSNSSQYFNSNETNTHVDDAEQQQCASSNQNL
ncbi:8270_t:CDS:2 [Ambispora gerdemannii]|uniref:8270_t:CDS:1 n=1 Tax=Ambispora gerdemannii TaxID=144530 RepID=A0A9N9GUR1_9GLOM|nr:8270_t:CDS:2 [Ambispora gerdemannii]